MIRTLRRHGNSLGLTFDKALLEPLGIDETTELELRTNGRMFMITPVERDHQARVCEAALRTMANHEKTLRKLAQSCPSSSPSWTCS
jgi:antitoxin component of MazEF toxin-antitoxin module